MSIQEYTITGNAFDLSKVFCEDYQYEIPSYQRPYSWEVEHIEQLFDDLYEFYERKTEESYFLGSIVIIKNPQDARSQVVDGQQRLTSLTILISALTYFLQGDVKTEAKNFIQQPEKKLQKIPAKPRLTLREKDNDFFRKYVQDIGFDDLRSFDVEKICQNDAQKNIYNNSIAILNKIESVFNSDLERIEGFFSFIITQCCLVIVSTPNQKSAFRIFSVMNNRGLDLLPIDILKADLIGKITNEQDKYTDIWEDLEQGLGRNRFNDLFTHIRMINLKNKPQKSILEEIQEQVITKISSFETFIEDDLSGYAEAFRMVSYSAYKASQNQDEVNVYLMWLNKTNFSEWIPSAILFLYKNKSNESNKLIVNFFKELERLSSYLYLTAKDVNKRISRFSTILDELERSPNEIPKSIYMTNNEKKELREQLDGDIYNMVSARRNFLILKTDFIISDNAATYKNQNELLTIEHVLPQTINENSKWRDWWKQDENGDDSLQKTWLHRLANLVPLNKRRNSAALNWDFDVKKEKYFSGNEGVSSYALTSQVLNENEWTPEVVKTRQENLLISLYKNWDLSEISTEAVD